MKKVLIVDDEQINLMMTDNILSTQYETLMASSAIEAIEMFKIEQPDMILTDLRMPGMSGFELQNTLQEQYAQTIPVMFMTADGSDENESEGLERGAVDFIRKPFRADVLLKRVDRILQNVDLKKAAQTDPMTGLLNKASSQDEISKAVRSIPGVLMMIDLDSFKLVNDIYGHSMGDRILIRFAEIIRSTLRSSDLVGRMGGDEFIAFCQHVKEEDVIAEKSKYINDELIKSAKEYMGEDMTIPLGASIGAVLAPMEGTDFLTLYKKADSALYEVKQNGKHGYSLYKDRFRQTQETSVTVGGVQNAMMILGERSRKKGAYSLPFEQFQLVYRFLSRVELNYHRANRIVLFTLQGENVSKEILGDMQEVFFEEVVNSLRASDVVTKNGHNQVIVLLLEADQRYSEMVVNRLKSKWHDIGDKKGVTMTEEMTIIE